MLVVTRLDRLGRSTRDLLNVIAALAERGAGFKSLKDTWADTTSPHGRLMRTAQRGRTTGFFPPCRNFFLDIGVTAMALELIQ